MPAATHLKSLQALEMAIRTGSLNAAAERLGITAAAVGQRIRSLENYLGSDLLLRGRSGLQPTAELSEAIADLRTGFAALDRATAALDFQRVAEIHVTADPDWADLWLLPRIEGFRAAHPNIRFCINGEGDVPTRLGASDCTIDLGPAGEPLFIDLLVPVCSADNTRRLNDWDPVLGMEGMPLLHVDPRNPRRQRQGWPDWFARFGHRRGGLERGVHYRSTGLALEAARQDVGFALCGYALVAADVARGTLFLPFPADEHLPARHPYRIAVRDRATERPQMRRFLDWLRGEARTTAEALQRLTDPKA